MHKEMTLSMEKKTKSINPWYREPFVWLLIAFPLTAVVAGFITLGLAISSDDGVVEDDYYLRGKEINRVLARDQAAATRGLQGRVELDDAQHQLLIRLTAREPGHDRGQRRAQIPARHAFRHRPDTDTRAPVRRHLSRAAAGTGAGPLERAARGAGLAPGRVAAHPER